MSQTPYHSLSPQERIIYKQRKELLGYIAKRFREEVTKIEDFLRLPTPTPGLETIRHFVRFMTFFSSNLFKVRVKLLVESCIYNVMFLVLDHL